MTKNKLPKPITLLILTLLTVVLWVGLSIYRTITVKPPTDVPQNISNPLNPTLDTNVINNIESAIYIPDSEIPALSVKQNEKPASVATPTPVSTPTPESTASASATQ